jgi:hypothetical protein
MRRTFVSLVVGGLVAACQLSFLAQPAAAAGNCSINYIYAPYIHWEYTSPPTKYLATTGKVSCDVVARHLSFTVEIRDSYGTLIKGYTDTYEPSILSDTITPMRKCLSTGNHYFYARARFQFPDFNSPWSAWQYSSTVLQSCWF